MSCCEECFDENEIIDFININGVYGTCDYCKSSDSKIIDEADLGEFVRKGINRAYANVESGEFVAHWDGETKAYVDFSLNEVGSSLFEILNDEHVIFSERLQTMDKCSELLQNLMDSSGPSIGKIQDRENDDLSDIHTVQFGNKNNLLGVDGIEENCVWEKFKDSCKYFNRFFDITKDSTREGLLNRLKLAFEYFVDYVEPGSVFYRARKCKLTTLKSDFIREIGPAPIECSINNRMSPAGISYTYLSTEADTCCKEIELQNGDTFLIGKFIISKRLKILDFSKKIWIPSESIFSENYNNDWNWINEFIENFANEISKPILPDDKDIEYVPSQILSEYIRLDGYNGITYKSSVNESGKNLVLFCGPVQNDNWPYLFDRLDSFENWLELAETKYYRADLHYQSIVL